MDTSRVVGGLIYYWGEYHPRGTADVVFRSLAAVRADSAILIRTPADWVAVAGGRVLDEQTAIDQCAEVVYATSQRRTPDFRPFVFRDAGSFDHLPFSIPDRRIADRLERPTLVRNSEELRLKFWVVERRDIRKYLCTLAPRSVDVQVVDSLPGYGFVS